MTLSAAPEPTGMALALGIERTAWSPGHTCLEVTVAPDHLNKGGAAHGGLMMVLLDGALGGALVSTLPETSWCATTQLTTSFLDAARLGERLVATGRVVRRGRHVAHLAGEVRAGERVVASAVGTWAIWDARPPSMSLRRADELLRNLVAAENSGFLGAGAWHHTGQSGMTSVMSVGVQRGGDDVTLLVDDVHALTLHERVFDPDGKRVHEDRCTYRRVPDGTLLLELHSTDGSLETVRVEEGARSLRAGPLPDGGPTWRHALTGDGLVMDLWFGGTSMDDAPDIEFRYRLGEGS
jgi:uncharacterized protein (TIGR00369 family)